MTDAHTIAAGHCRLGIGTADITPPSDAYHRNWGAALHDAAEGVHRPLLARVALLELDGTAHLLVTLDLGWLRRREMESLLQRVAQDTGIAPSCLSVTFSHTHAAINLDLERTDQPGGRHIEPYLAALPAHIAAAAAQARQSLQEAHLSYARGRCDLAWARDFWDAERRAYACGPDPGSPGDDTLLLMRASDADGKPLAHLVNYACHPTTLAWDNRLISPDYIGAMRQTVEEATGVPCLFLQGASGDMGPRDGFVGDTAVADRNGRQLGYAALAAIEGLPPAATQMEYDGPLVSGATLGIWQHRPLDAAAVQALGLSRSAEIDVELELRPLPTRAELDARLESLEADLQQAEDDGDADLQRDLRAYTERTRRLMRRLEEVSPDGRASYRVQLWQIGQGVFVLLGGEPYNLLQRRLRARFPRTAVFVGVLCNQPHSYLLPATRYGLGIYQDDCATVAPGSLEKVIDAVADRLHQWGLD